LAGEDIARLAGKSLEDRRFSGSFSLSSEGHSENIFSLKAMIVKIVDDPKRCKS
jgi:hypothetical protein